MSKATIFVRERSQIEEGEKKPRFSIVGVAGSDLKLYAKHIRKKELEEITSHIGAEIVYLKAGKDDEEIEVES